MKIGVAVVGVSPFVGSFELHVAMMNEYSLPKRQRLTWYKNQKKKKKKKRRTKTQQHQLQASRLVKRQYLKTGYVVCQIMMMKIDDYFDSADVADHY